MSMSKKDYEAIARRIKSITTDSPLSQYEVGMIDAARQIAASMANYCAADNPRFDRARFLAACGVQS